MSNLKIYKYEVLVEAEMIIEMPKSSKIISVGTQRLGYVCFWAIVNVAVGSEIENRFFRCYGTGHPLEASDLNKFIGTVFDGPFVWHIFGDKE